MLCMRCNKVEAPVGNPYCDGCQAIIQDVPRARQTTFIELPIKSGHAYVKPIVTDVRIKIVCPCGNDWFIGNLDLAQECRDCHLVYAVSVHSTIRRPDNGT